jgi:hypothetical protein
MTGGKGAISMVLLSLCTGALTLNSLEHQGQPEYDEEALDQAAEDESNHNNEGMAIEEWGKRQTIISFIDKMQSNRRALCSRSFRIIREGLEIGIGLLGAGLGVYCILDGQKRFIEVTMEPNYTDYLNTSPRCTVNVDGYVGLIDPTCEALLLRANIAQQEQLLGGILCFPIALLCLPAGLGGIFLECWDYWRAPS